MKNLIEAAEAALKEMKNIHGLMCLGPDHCPIAKTMQDLELAIGEAKLASAAPAPHVSAFEMCCRVDAAREEPEATYPAHTVKDIDPSPSRPSFMPAQRLCVICDAVLPPDADIHTNTCPNCGTAGGI